MRFKVKSKTIWNVLLLAILATCILPILIATFYGVPAADDFSFAGPYLTFSENKFLYPFWKVVDMYQNWQGTYFSTFLAAIPVYQLGKFRGLHIEMFLNAIFFLGSIFMCINSLVRRISIEKEKHFTVVLCFTTSVVFYTLCTNQLAEMFYWHTGLAAYTIPLSFAFLAIHFYVNYSMKKQKRQIVIGAICSFCSAGGPLNITAFLCSMLLLFVLYDLFIGRNIKTNSAIGISALVGAIINVAAPGNFVRHANFDSEIRVGAAGAKTILRINDRLSDERYIGFLVVIIIVTFIVAYKNLGNSHFEFKFPVLVTLYCCAAIHITDFPVILGYSNFYLPDRCVFVETVSSILFLMISTIYWAGWAASKRVFHFSNEIILVLVIVCGMILSNYFNIFNMLELTPYEMAYNLVKGNYSMEVQNQKEIIRQLETSSEKNVVITLRNPNPETNLMEIGLTDDPTWWVNRDVARYFGKDSIVLQYIEE